MGTNTPPVDQTPPQTTQEAPSTSDSPSREDSPPPQDPLKRWKPVRQRQRPAALQGLLTAQQQTASNTQASTSQASVQAETSSQANSASAMPSPSPESEPESATEPTPSPMDATELTAMLELLGNTELTAHMLTLNMCLRNIHQMICHSKLDDDLPLQEAKEQLLCAFDNLHALLIANVLTDLIAACRAILKQLSSYYPHCNQEPLLSQKLNELRMQRLFTVPMGALMSARGDEPIRILLGQELAKNPLSKDGGAGAGAILESLMDQLADILTIGITIETQASIVIKEKSCQ